ncbi:hypothetical protein LR48_Vigan04g110200 [Vigna angularis]|uniref:Uncharacterized protein n=1 Tax=Phaseolus angularis TaxID=3914 RepID=A0A0L9T699_PHAAN|nr:hypothetical protein LR48_Vigan231s000800 [Vigna angularis]KOM40904.1 hypothetical protein LR48_Vigan04g110200 [Vigna angularis]
MTTSFECFTKDEPTYTSFESSQRMTTSFECFTKDELPLPNTSLDTPRMNQLFLYHRRSIPPTLQTEFP